MTTTQARLAMGGRAELESQLPLLDAGRESACQVLVIPCKMCYHRSLNWAG